MTLPQQVHRLGSRHVNWYVVEADDGLTVVDTGLPGHQDQFPALLARLGRTADEVRAIVLTHWHADHIGNAEALRRETGARVLVPAADAPIVRGDEPMHRPNFFPYLWRPAMIRYLASVVRDGATRVVPVAEVTTYEDGEVLDVPGTPRVIHTPGHTRGHSSLLFEGHDSLLAGDVLATLDTLRWRGDPRPLPIQDDADETIRSLERLASVEAGTLLAGHGEPWTQGAAEAVRRAIAAGVP